MHVKLVKVTTNRQYFTKHGLHLNNKGKEKMSNELLKNLSTMHKAKKLQQSTYPGKMILQKWVPESQRM
jgi:hypothetical protein